MSADIPEFGGTVGFADGNVAFCNACGWRGVATYLGGTNIRRFIGVAIRHGHPVEMHRRPVNPRPGTASTDCPYCTRWRPPVVPLRHIHAKSKRKAARAARRRNR